MNGIKPHSIDVEQKEIEQDIKSSVKPHIKEPIGESEIEKELGKDTQKEGGFKLLKLFSSLGGLFLSIAFLVVMVVVGQFVVSIKELFVEPNIADVLYIVGISVVLLAVSLHIWKLLKEITSLKSAEKTKNEYKKEQADPSKNILKLSLQAISLYEKSSDKQVLQEVDRLKAKLGSSIVYEELLELNLSLYKAVDKKADRLIKNASLQAALSTAISPVPVVDMLLIFYRSVYLAYEISKLYGYKGGVLSAYVIIKRAVFNIAFAGGSEMLVQYSGDIGTSSSLSMLSKSLGQGLANGVLMVRVGESIKKACRPVEVKEDSGAIKSIISSLVEELRVKH
jgi:putative membrane protein